MELIKKISKAMLLDPQEAEERAFVAEQLKARAKDESRIEGRPISYSIEGVTFDFRTSQSLLFDGSPFASGKFRKAFRGQILATYEGDDVFAKEPWWRVPKESGGCWKCGKQIDGAIICQNGKQLHFGCRQTQLPYFHHDNPYGQRLRYNCVVKMLRQVPDSSDSVGLWTPDLAALQMAHDYAEQFNLEIRPETRIKFVPACLFEVVRNSTEFEGVRIHNKVLVEPLLEGDIAFTKLNSNTGWVLSTQTIFGLQWLMMNYAAQFIGYDLDIAQAFSHWTWAKSEGLYLVCELQGTWSQNSWHLTDPAIHSADPSKRFGTTNFGAKGINAFFSTHKCSRYCRHLKKPDILIDSDLQPVQRTSFVFEETNVSWSVHEQVGGTCYAHAVATTVRSAEKRIVGRRVEAHRDMVDRIVSKHGRNGCGDCSVVLQEECPPRCLKFAALRLQEVGKVIHCGRTVLLSFSLCHDAWNAFSNFFRLSPNGELTADVLEPFASNSSRKEGHAVVIIGESGDIFKIKNSWGYTWADAGFFRVHKQCFRHMNATFFDIFFLEHDLTQEDKRHYAMYIDQESANFHELFRAPPRDRSSTTNSDPNSKNEHAVLENVVLCTCKDRIVVAEAAAEYQDHVPIEYKDGDGPVSDLVSVLYESLPDGARRQNAIKPDPNGKRYIVYVPKCDVQELYDAYKKVFKKVFTDARSHARAIGTSRRPRLIFPPFSAPDAAQVQ